MIETRSIRSLTFAIDKYAIYQKVEPNHVFDFFWNPLMFILFLFGKWYMIGWYSEEEYCFVETFATPYETPLLVFLRPSVHTETMKTSNESLPFLLISQL
jgi:hypothetical protein